MPKNLMLLVLLLCSMRAFAQVPQSFNYQAIVRDADGVVVNENVNITVKLLQNGEVIYVEDHDNLNTGSLGRINFKIGEGADPSSDFTQIQWGGGNMEIDISIDGESLGMFELNSVPYSNYALESGTDKDWSLNGDSVIYTTNTRVGIGTSDPEFSLQVEGEKIRLNGNEGPSFEVNTPSSSTLSPEFRFAIDDERVGTVQLRRDPNLLLLWENLSSGPTSMVLRNGRVGVNTLSPSDQLHVRGILRVQGVDTHQKIRMYSSSSTLDNRITSYDENSDLMWQMMMGRRSNSDRFEIDRPGNGVSDFYIDVNARTHVRTLQIHGGSDINEDFDSSVKLSPGDVVVIDVQNEGELCHTSMEYDRKVAGVISGANGVNPGLSLSQEDVLEGDYPLAMLGRVYVKVTGPVVAGEMLTTSSKPGFAMVVNDYDRSRGAVIGKAMSSNEGGEGMVLVLIQPQ